MPDQPTSPAIFAADAVEVLTLRIALYIAISTLEKARETGHEEYPADDLYIRNQMCTFIEKAKVCLRDEVAGE